MSKKTDSQIQTDVLNELRWDLRVKETEIGVVVHDGIVTLEGTVDSWGRRVAAEKAAHRVIGVLDVANELTVKLPSSHERDDTDIARTVRSALEWDVFVPSEKIHTTVSNGCVTLEGEVSYMSQREDAARAVRNLVGVKTVVNRLTVAAPSVPTAAVRAAIEGALARHAAHAAKHVNIAVDDDKVTLSGEVPSWAEHEAIEGAVRGTHGVRRVINRLQIHA